MATKSKCRLPDLYDGSSSATRFFKRYEICCELNKWETDNDKVGQLYPLLADRVFDFVSELPAADKARYNRVKKRVIAEYEDLELEETYAERFSAMRLKKEDDLGAFMAELKKLVVKAYPTFDEKDRAKLVINQFMKSLSAGARRHIMLQPKQEEALTMASCDEVLNEARLINQIERSPSCQDEPRVAAVESAETSNPQLDKILSALEDLTKVVGESAAAPSVSRVQEPRQSQRSRSGRGRNYQFRGNCFRCGEPGHMARNCNRNVGKSGSSPCKACGNRGPREWSLN